MLTQRLCFQPLEWMTLEISWNFAASLYFYHHIIWKLSRIWRRTNAQISLTTFLLFVVMYLHSCSLLCNTSTTQRQLLYDQEYIFNLSIFTLTLMPSNTKDVCPACRSRNSSDFRVNHKIIETLDFRERKKLLQHPVVPRSCSLASSSQD